LRTKDLDVVGEFQVGRVTMSGNMGFRPLFGCVGVLNSLAVRAIPSNVNDLGLRRSWGPYLSLQSQGVQKQKQKRFSRTFALLKQGVAQYTEKKSESGNRTRNPRGNKQTAVPPRYHGKRL
jgi:hypothetical protein